MADIEFIEGTDPARPGAFYLKGTEALKPGAALAIFERLVGRPATAEERAEVERDEADDGDGHIHVEDGKTLQDIVQELDAELPEAMRRQFKETDG